jgi:dihydroorotate dehydrogenase
MNAIADAGVDFIELNESCPNVAHHTSVSNSDGLDSEMVNRLDFISDKFLKHRTKNLPLIVKYSVDTNPALLNKLLPLLINHNFDGINLGNTSTTYTEYSEHINIKELEAFKYFTENFGGGVSGQLISNKSLNLTRTASEILSSINLNKEFHIIRTGGIESKQDLEDSKLAGASLNQWYTGYFENFSLHGHKVYKNII